MEAEISWEKQSRERTGRGGVWSWRFGKKCSTAEMQCCGLEDMRGLGICLKSNFRGLTCQEIKRFL